MQKWADNLNNIQKDGQVIQPIIAAINHYPGLGLEQLTFYKHVGVARCELGKKRREGATDATLGARLRPAHDY